MIHFMYVEKIKFLVPLSILICMDIQENPGPVSEGNYSLDIIHLNTRSIRIKLIICQT